MIKIANGDLLKSDANIIGHQVNGLGIMGAGVALQVKRKYPSAYKKYKTICNPLWPSKNLGMCQIVDVSKDNSEIKYVANLFGQARIGHGQQTDYPKLRDALEDLKIFAKERNLSIGLPYNLGCGLAGGRWGIVKAILEEVFEDYDCTLYKL